MDRSIDSHGHETPSFGCCEASRCTAGNYHNFGCDTIAVPHWPADYPTQKNFRRAEYILDHYSRSFEDKLVLARALDRHDAEIITASRKG